MQTSKIILMAQQAAEEIHILEQAREKEKEKKKKEEEKKKI